MVTGEPALKICVKVWTVELGTLLPLFTRVNFEVARMVLLLFPPVRGRAAIVLRTPIGISFDEIVDFPVFAKVSRVVINVGLSSEVLPVVGVDASLLVVILAPRTPRSLKVKHVKVRISWHFV